jgi:CBS domain-containing protein
MSNLVTPQQGRYWRNLFLEARDAAFRDAEGFQNILFALEKLGQFLLEETANLGEYKPIISALASDSCLADEIPAICRQWHTPFQELYDLVKDARNDAMHQGSRARHLTEHAMSLSLVLEDALMANAYKVSDFMVSDPVVALPWQPVSHAREKLLTHGFSFLPIWIAEQPGPGWFLISDYAVTKYLRVSDKRVRRQRLATRIEKAISPKEIELIPCLTRDPEWPAEEMVSKFDGKPVLVVDESRPENLLGIVTAFDLM